MPASAKLVLSVPPPCLLSVCLPGVTDHDALVSTAASGSGASRLLRWRRIHWRCPSLRHLEPHLVRIHCGRFPLWRGCSAGAHCHFKGRLSPRPVRCQQVVRHLPAATGRSGAAITTRQRAGVPMHAACSGSRVAEHSLGVGYTCRPHWYLRLGRSRRSSGALSLSGVSLSSHAQVCCPALVRRYAP